MQGRSLAGEVWFNIVGHPMPVERGGLVEMEEGQTYKIRFGNYSDRRWNVYVSIDGNQLPGALRLQANNSWTLETIPDTELEFIFRSTQSQVGQVAGVGNINPAERGVVELRFVPEKEQSIERISRKDPFLKGSGELESYDAPRSKAPDLSGGTVMGGHSDQQFVSAPRIQEDHLNEVTLRVRLVLKENPSYPQRPMTVEDTLANLKKDTYFKRYNN